MVVLSFTLSEEGVTVLRDALSCMFKFSDDVCMEARKDKLILTTLNISKSAYVCFTFASNRFFSKYQFSGNAQYRDRFSCQLYIKSLLSVFRSRQGGTAEQDGSIERCDVAIDDGPGKKSRLIARISCRNGITASHALAFEPKAPTHAKFDKNEAGNHWSISSRTLRQLMDHFGPGIELLDINTDDENRVVNFTCFTEKVTKRGGDNEAVLKKPLHTNIAVEMDEFNDVEVQDKLHIIISVKDFRAILQHAQLVSGELVTCYSDPGRPMKLSYNGDGTLCEFILMTVGEKDAAAQKHKQPRAASAKPTAAAAAKAALDAASHRDSSSALQRQQNGNQRQQSQQQQKSRPKELSQQQPTPQQRTPMGSRQPGFEIRPKPLPPSQPPQQPPPGTAESESLFVEQDDDALWAPVDDPEEEDNEADNDRLEWNATDEPTRTSSIRINSYMPRPAEATENAATDHLAAGLEPTQRLAEVRRFGLFPAGYMS